MLVGLYGKVDYGISQCQICRSMINHNWLYIVIFSMLHTEKRVRVKPGIDNYIVGRLRIDSPQKLVESSISPWNRKPASN